MFFKYNTLGIIWAVIVLILSLMPGRDLPDLSLWDVIGLDKIAHMIFYFVLTGLFLRGFSKQYQFNSLRYSPVVWSLSLSILYGILIEILQETLISERHFDIWDVTANIIGSLIAVLVYDQLFLKGKTFKL